MLLCQHYTMEHPTVSRFVRYNRKFCGQKPGQTIVANMTRTWQHRNTMETSDLPSLPRDSPVPLQNDNFLLKFNANSGWEDESMYWPRWKAARFLKQILKPVGMLLAQIESMSTGKSRLASQALAFQIALAWKLGSTGKNGTGQEPQEPTHHVPCPIEIYHFWPPSIPWPFVLYNSPVRPMRNLRWALQPTVNEYRIATR